MEHDIKYRIEKDFGVESNRALELIDLFEEKNKLSPRVSRCLVYLSKGNLSILKSKIKEAEVDWRDIIYDAEEINFDSNNPFER